MQTKTPKIAFIGMEGSGKTVLISVLAKKMSEIISQGYYLDPQNNRTFQYVENVWMTLQNGEWPPSTPPGERFKLDWKLKQGENECDVRMIDAAGQDFRLLFTGEEVDIDENEMPAQLVSLANYCREADILLFTINIKDFVGESDSTRMTENQGAIKQALDFLKKGNKRIALLFTQYDQYSSMIEKSGGLQEFCKQKLRYIYNAYINEGKTEIIGVAAVNETEMREMEDGTLQRVPVQNFSSEGLIEVINWIVDKVIEVSKEKTVEFISEQYVKNENEEQINPTYHAGAENQVGNESTDRIATPSENAFGTPLWVKSVQPFWGYLVRGIQGVSLIQTIIGILFILTVIMGIKWLCAGSVVEPKQPVPVVLEKLVVPVCEKGFLGCKSHNALVKVTVRNNGDPGKVTIGAHLEDAEESKITPKQTEVHYMRKNEKKTYEINFKNLKLCPENTKCNPEVKVRSTP